VTERELAALEAAAKAATPGEWEYFEELSGEHEAEKLYRWGVWRKPEQHPTICYSPVYGDGADGTPAINDLAFIAAANPAAVLRLAAAYREALALLGDSETALDHYTSAQVVAGAKTRWICTPDCPACAWELRRAALLAGGGGEVQAP
jgi:hypothetical protein